MSILPISGSAYTFSLSLFSQATGDVVANPTLAAGDFNISTDGGAFAALDTTPAVTPAGGRVVEFNLTSAEVGTAHFCIQCIDAAGAEWKTLMYHETVGDASDFKADVSGLATATALGIVDGKCTSTLTNTVNIETKTDTIISTGSTGPWTTASGIGGGYVDGPVIGIVEDEEITTGIVAD